MTKTPFSLLAIALLLASSMAGPATLAQPNPLPPSDPVPDFPALPVPSAPALCQWTDTGLAANAPDSNGAAFLAFSIGYSDVLFQVSSGAGLPTGSPLAFCPGTNAYPCAQNLATEAGYAVLWGQVLCYQPTQDAVPANEALVEAACQLSTGYGFSTPACPEPQQPESGSPNSPDSPESGSPDSPQAGTSDCPLDDLLSGSSIGSNMYAAPCLDSVNLPCQDQECSIDPCASPTSSSMDSGIDCLPCNPISDCTPEACKPLSECIPCPDGDVDNCVDAGCDGGGISCWTNPCGVGTVNCPPCLESPRDCGGLPCSGLNCIQDVCDKIGGCDVDPLDCGGAGEPDCVTWLCNQFSLDDQSGECGISTCEDYNGNCVAYACDLVTTPDCHVPLVCGGAGQEDCVTYLCHRAGRDGDDCNPVEIIGPLVSYVVEVALSCALGQEPPPGAPNCPFLIEEIVGIISNLVDSIWPLANGVAQAARDCVNGQGTPACDQVQRSFDEAVGLANELTLGALGLAQQCLDEMRGTPGADSPVDCERLGEPGEAVERYLGNVLLTLQEATTTVQGCLDNVATTGGCDPPCDATCDSSCDLCQPCGNVGCGPPVALARSLPAPALPVDLGRSFEATLPESGIPPAQGGDVDHDGLPDLFDIVNLPSEAQRWTGGDRLTVPQGLGQGGFLLLVEPSHAEAQLILADTAPEDVQGLDASAALDAIASRHGVEVRNALATVVNKDMIVHTTWAGADSPINQSLEWSQARPADGTWLLARSDPTRLVSGLQLGGLAAAVAAPAASHYTALGLNDYRWEFLDLQGVPNFCFDAAGTHGLLPCNGAPAAEWLRAYSGQAAYALGSLESALEAGLIPVATDIESASPAQVEAGSVNARFPFPTAGPLPAGDAQDVRDTDDDGRTVEPNGQADAVESYLYVDPDEFQAYTGDLFSGAAAGWTLHAVPSTGQSAVTMRVGDVWGTPGKELFVVQVADSLKAATLCALRSGNGVAFYQAAAAYRSDSAKPCGNALPSWVRINPIGAEIGVLVGGELMTRTTPYQPLLTVLDKDSNNVPESILLTLPDPTSCGADTKSCTKYTSLSIPVEDEALPTGPALPDVQPLPEPTYIGEPASGSIDIFDPASPLHLLGSESMRLPDAVGGDYLLPVRGGQVSDTALLQWPIGDGSSVSTDTAPRLFHFAGTYMNMPGEPRDLVTLQFLIDSADGNEQSQDFLLNGRVLGSYLDALSDETLVADVDEAHRDGFSQRLLDADGDGYLDLLVHIPHFSETELRVTNSNEETHADFWEVHLTGGPLKGWVSGAYGAVFRLDGGILHRIPVQNLDTGQILPDDQRTLGMSMLSDSEFYVATTNSRDQWCHDDSKDGSPSIAHYNNGVWDIVRLSQITPGFQCNDVHDVWMNSAHTLGYAGGSEGMWLIYQYGSWSSLTRGTLCGIMDLEFDGSGAGYVAVDKSETEDCGAIDGTPVMRYNGGWTTQSVPGSGQMFDISPDGTYAVGLQGSVYSKGGGTSWIRDGNAPAGQYEGVDRDDAGDVWVAASNPNRCQSCTFVSRIHQGSWTTFELNEGVERMRDIDMYAPGIGMAAGWSALVVIQPPPKIDIYDTLSPSSGYAGTDFTGTDQGSTSTVDGPLTHQWSWGDGTTTEGASATHRYSSLGWKDVTHTVTDADGNTAQKAQQVFVDAQDLGTVTSSQARQVIGSFPSDGEAHSEQFRITYTGFLNVKAEFVSGDASLQVRGNVGGPVEGAGNWPYPGASEHTMDGSVPNGGTLYVSVDRPAGGPGGPYTLRLSEVTPTTLSSKMTPGTTPSKVTYLDRVRFSVTWTDALGPNSPPQVILAGTPHNMLPPSGPLNYAAGVTYSYETTLQSGRSYRPIYKATQGSQDHTDIGQPVTVTVASATYNDFKNDDQGSIPWGFNPTTPAGKCCNYWHIEDTDNSRFPSTVQMSHHGKVAWFGNAHYGDYRSTSSQAVAGALETPMYDMRLLSNPVLSFASYYETQDTVGTDKMSLQVNSKDPTGSWIGWQDLRTIEGYEGGYKQWKTQLVPLDASLQGKLVKFRFEFEASGTDDDFLGWMIDDVAVGSDYDGDLLPDRAERELLHGQVSRTVGTAIMGSDGVAVQNVRRLDRPYGETEVMHALLTLPHASQTSIWVGAKDEASNQISRIPVFSPGGGDAGRCSGPGKSVQSSSSKPEAFGNQPFPNAYSQDHAESRQTGWLVFDLARCNITGNRFLAQSDWFIEADDAGADAAHPVIIESVYVESVGRTDGLLADTDADGLDDGQETVQIGRDPLGVDQDRDGQPEGIDANDAVADWIPAAMVQVDLNNRVTAALTDLPAKIMRVGMRITLANGDNQDLAPAVYSQTSWTFQLPLDEATALTFDWNDAMGGNGVLKADLHRYGGHGYALYRPTLAYTNTNVQYGVTTQNLYDDQRQEGDTVWFGRVDEFFPDAQDVLESFHDGMKGVTSAPRFGLVLLGFFVGKQIHPKEQAWPTAPAGVSFAKRSGAGPTYLYAPNSLASEAGRNLSVSDLQAAMNNGQLLLPDKSGSVRLLYESAGGPILVRLAGAFVHDAWKWPAGAQPDFESGVGTDSFIQSETNRANALGGNFQQKAEVRHCMQTCGWRNQDVHLMEFDGALASGFVDEGTPLRLGDEAFQSLRSSYDISVYLGTTFKPEADNDALGETSIGYASYLASNDRLRTANIPGQYWDNNAGSHKADCGSILAIDLQTRRCSAVSVATTAQSYSWASQNDGFRVHDLQWRHKTSNAVQFQDKVAMDALLSTRQGPPAPDGMARYEDAVNRMGGTYQPPAHVAGIYAGIDWSTPVQPQIGIYYKENP